MLLLSSKRTFTPVICHWWLMRFILDQLFLRADNCWGLCHLSSLRRSCHGKLGSWLRGLVEFDDGVWAHLTLSNILIVAIAVVWYLDLRLDIDERSRLQIKRPVPQLMNASWWQLIFQTDNKVGIDRFLVSFRRFYLWLGHLWGWHSYSWVMSKVVSCCQLMVDLVVLELWACFSPEIGRA